MRTVALTQRVEISSHGERRDCIDQRWYDFLENCELFPLMIPNSLESAKLLMEKHEFLGIILTGGNDLLSLGGNAPERDEVETLLLEKSLREKIPLIGVCRGLQFLVNYFGSVLERVDGHVGENHEIQIGEQTRLVNSFHHWGARNVVSPLKLNARSSDGIIEAVSHESAPIKGIMWHPERVDPFDSQDLLFFSEHFGEVIK